MSKVRVLVGTRKGAFVLSSDGKRQKWDVSGPHFAGGEMYHLKGSPAEPNRIYASQTSGWFGQIIQRSDDGGKTWIQPATPPGEKDPAPVASAFTPSLWIRAILSESISPSQPQVHSAPTMATRRGSQSTRAFVRNIFLIPMPKLVTAFITSRCIPRARTSSSCRSTGT